MPSKKSLPGDYFSSQLVTDSVSITILFCKKKLYKKIVNLLSLPQRKNYDSFSGGKSFFG